MRFFCLLIQFFKKFPGMFGKGELRNPPNPPYIFNVTIIIMNLNQFKALQFVEHVKITVSLYEVCLIVTFSTLPSSWNRVKANIQANYI